MRVELEIGESIVVTFKDTDGEVTVAFADQSNILTGCREDVARKLQALGGITVHADMPDTAGREGVVYHEPLGLVSDDGFKLPYESSLVPSTRTHVLIEGVEGIADGWYKRRSPRG